MTHFSSYAQFIKYAFVSIMSHVPPSTTYRIYTYACRVLRQKFFKVLPIGVSESYSHANYETEPTDNCNRWQASEQDIYVVVTQEETYMLIWPLIRLLKLHHLGHLIFQVLMQTQPGWHTCKCRHAYMRLKLTYGNIVFVFVLIIIITIITITITIVVVGCRWQCWIIPKVYKCRSYGRWASVGVVGSWATEWLKRWVEWLKWHSCCIQMSWRGCQSEKIVQSYAYFK